MKDEKDLSTVDFIGVKRPRGRPPTGNAMTGAQRMRKSREKRGIAPLAVELPNDVLDGIEKYRLGKDLTQSQVIESVVRNQLLRKR